MAQVVEWMTGILKVQGSHLTPNILKLCVFGHGLPLIKKTFYLLQGNVIVKMVEQLISKFKVVGSTPTTLFDFFFFFSYTYS